MKYLLLIILFIPSIVNSQSITVSPNSFEFWGSETNITAVGIDYKQIGVTYYSTNHISIHWLPINIKNIIKFGVVAFNKPFPTNNSLKINTKFDIGYSFNRFRISYVHISNGNRGLSNNGYDNIILHLKF